MHVAVGGFVLDGLNESLCACVNVTTCQINKGLRSLNMAAYERRENSDSWPACIFVQQTEPKSLPKHTQDSESSTLHPVTASMSVADLNKNERGCIGFLSVTDGPKFSASVWKCLLLHLHNVKSQIEEVCFPSWTQKFLRKTNSLWTFKSAWWPASLQW